MLIDGKTANEIMLYNESKVEQKEKTVDEILKIAEDRLLKKTTEEKKDVKEVKSQDNDEIKKKETKKKVVKKEKTETIKTKEGTSKKNTRSKKEVSDK